MSTALFITIDGTRHDLTTAFEGADHATVVGGMACPRCGARALGIAGSGRRIAADDRAYEADGYATCCRAYLGVIRAETGTLFGVREDEAVLLRGRVRVY